MEVVKKIIEMQNNICINEFKRNYNKTEYQRFFEPKTDDVKELKKFLDENMPKEFIYEVSSTGTIQVLKVIEKTDLCSTRQVVKTIHPTWEAPYQYVMGKKVSKKTMQEWLNSTLA